jgi:DAACS family dicarboxylate/amino acid:cation (Na+ or H+) symporter
MPQAASASSRFRLGLPTQIGIALALGALIGLIWPAAGAALQPLGSAFVAAVKMVVIPLVFCAVALGTFKMGLDTPRLGRVALVAFGWFYLAGAIAISIGLGLDALFHPGRGISLSGAPEAPAPAHALATINWTQFLLDLIPSNVVAAMAQQKVLPTLVFAALFGFGLASLGAARAKPMAEVLGSILAVMFRITGWIVALAPVAVLAVVAWLTATQGSSTLWSLAKLIAVMYAGYALFALLCLAAFALLYPRPIRLAREMLAPALLAFVTRSSEVALPLHIEKLEALGFENRTVSVVLPLGYSFNLDGSALYIGLATTFICEAYGLQLSFGRLLTILGAALLASKGVANVPAGSLVALSSVLLALGLPADALALVAGVDVFLDMGRTGLNVFGNTLCVLIVRRFGERSAGAASLRTSAPL